MTTPREIADFLTTLIKGKVVELEIAEGSFGLPWSVRATVQPKDARRRPVKFSEHGETRASAIEEFVRKAEINVICFECAE